MEQQQTNKQEQPNIRYLYFPAPGSLLVPRPPGPAPGTKFVFPGPGLQFVFTSSDPQFVFIPNFHLPAQPGLGLHIPTFSFQFVFTGPDL